MIVRSSVVLLTFVSTFAQGAEWTTSTTVDPFTDSKIISALIDIGNARIVVRCDNNSLRAYVIFDDYLGGEGL